MSAASLAFKIIYNALYYFLYLVLLAFLIVTPADLIHQALVYNQIYIILVIALCYLVTIIIVSLIYAARLYISRSVLASIPKQWIPVEKGDLPRDVRHMVVEYLSRSAAITFESRPRIPLLSTSHGSRQGAEDSRQEESAVRGGVQVHKLKKKGLEHGAIAVTIPPHRPPWGEIEHPGWASPLSEDLPDLQYSSVISELPNLIEAKALTLAPQDPQAQGQQPMLDAEAVGLLQRADNMGLRDYLAHLAELGVLVPSPTIADFLTKYEFARFSAKPLTSQRFRELMHLFAEVLRAMNPMNPALLDPEDDDSDDKSLHAPPYDTDIDNDAPLGTNPSTPTSRRSLRSHRSVESIRVVRQGSTSTTSSRPHRPGLVARNSSANTWQFRTAPTTPKSRRTAVSRSSSANTFAQTRNPYHPESLGSTPSLRSESGGSVIRLADADDDTDLPYVLKHPRTQ